jgi:hypothetical protein
MRKLAAQVYEVLMATVSKAARLAKMQTPGVLTLQTDEGH